MGMPIPTSLPSEARDLNTPVGRAIRQVFGLAGSTLLAHASQSGVDQCSELSFRSCLPLRDSPGFSPGSLFTADVSSAAPNRETQYTALGDPRQSIYWGYARCCNCAVGFGCPLRKEVSRCDGLARVVLGTCCCLDALFLRHQGSVLRNRRSY